MLLLLGILLLLILGFLYFNDKSSFLNNTVNVLENIISTLQTLTAKVKKMADETI